MAEEIRGTDISKPIDHLEMDGREYPLAFDMNSMRVAEDVYELHYNRICGFAQIVQHLIAGRVGAIMAILYGALDSGAREKNEEPMPWEEYADKFRLSSIPTVRELLEKNLKKALPKAEAGGANPQ